MSHHRSRRIGLFSLACLALPAAVQAQAVLPLSARLTPVLVFLHATPLVKLIMLGLIAATIAAVVICIRKLLSGPRLAGGSAFLSGLRAGGPLAGCLGACNAVLNMCLGIANRPTPPSINVLAPGIAEAVLLVGLGVMAGAVAVIAHWALEARIDRAVLKPS
jgi:biopolymer transport protein ExbB/TolQ